MALIDDLGLDPNRVGRRIHFLDGRANFHRNRKDGRREFNLACAAALWRDAASLELLRGKAERARELLMQAGSQFVKIGLFYGFFLISLVDPHFLRDQYGRELSILIDTLSRRVRPIDASDLLDADRGYRGLEEPNPASLTLASIGSTRQMVHLLQAFEICEDDDDIARSFISILRDRLLQTPATPIGPTGLPLHSYIRLLSASRGDRLPENVLNMLTAVAGLRAQQIEAAQADRHHWRLALAPSDLIDFDLLAIATARWNASQTIDDFEEPFRRWKNGVNAPFRAAIELSSPQQRPQPFPSL